MTQCLDARPFEQMLTPLPAASDLNESNAGGWALLVVVAIILAFEVWALKSGRPTISQWVQRKARGRWWKWFGVVAVGLLLWHLFEGGPL